MSEEYERIGSLLEYLGDEDYDDGRDGYLTWSDTGEVNSDDWKVYRVRFERDGHTLQGWQVAIHEDD